MQNRKHSSTGPHEKELICEKQELNLRTPSGTDLESASVGHLDILAQNTIGSGIVKGFDSAGILCQVLLPVRFFYRR
jgi:hypothetical protein